MKFKHGQKVIVETEEHGTIRDARISIDKEGDPFICHNEDGLYKYRMGHDFGYKNAYMLDKDFTNEDIISIKPALKTFSDPQVGDEYQDEDGASRFVLGVVGRLIGLSYRDNKNSLSIWYTKEELMLYDYIIIQDEETEEVEEVTMEQVCEKFGKDVKIKKE